MVATASAYFDNVGERIFFPQPAVSLWLAQPRLNISQ